MTSLGRMALKFWLSLAVVSFFICVTKCDDGGNNNILPKYKLELLVVVDNLDLQRYVNSYGYTEAAARTVLVEEVNYFVKEMGEMFQSGKRHGFDLQLLLSGTVIMDLNQTMVKPGDVLPGSRRIKGGTLLNRCASWLKDNDVYSNYTYDVALLYTAYKIGAAGLSYLGNVCNFKRNCVLVNNHGTFAFSVHAAAHELAHALGAKHDKSTPCTKAGGHVMSGTWGSNNRWTFSNCSVDAFKAKMKKLGSKNCLLQTDPKSLEYKPPTVIPRDVGDLRVVCRRNYGKDYFPCTTTPSTCGLVSCTKDTYVPGKKQKCRKTEASDMMKCPAGEGTCNDGKCISHFG